MKKIKGIIRAYFLATLYSVGFLNDPELIKVITKREKTCKTCVLRSGGWCSNKMVKRVYTGKQFMSPLGILMHKVEVVKGCGCWLKAKIWSKFKFNENDNPCPLKKW